MSLEDLLTIVEQSTRIKRVASTNGGEYAGPCPFCGGEDRFRCWPEDPEGPGWWCRQCERGGDVIAFLVERGDITPQEAGRMRREAAPSGSAPHRRRSSSPSTPSPPVRDLGDPPPAAWRKQADLFVGYCQEILFTKGGRVGLEYLHGRGLTDATTRAWGLGYHETKRFRPPERWGLEASGKKVYLPAGVVIPWTVDGEIWQVKTRRLGGEDPKYIQVRGGQPTLYGLDLVKGSRVLVICEGELDAALLWQEAGDLVDVVAIGSKTARVPTAYLDTLAKATRWLVAFDVDAEKKAQQWGTWSARVRRARPLQGNDLTDFYLEGGDLRQWVTYHLEKIEVETQQAAAGTTTTTVAGNGEEELAEALLTQEVSTPEEWRRSWAKVAQVAGWPCWGTTWDRWVECR